MSVLDPVHTGSMLSPRSSLCPEPSPPAYGMSCLELSLPALDLITFESPLLMQGLCCSGSLTSTYGMSQPGFSLLILDFIHTGFFLSLHGPAQLDSTSLASGLV